MLSQTKPLASAPPAATHQAHTELNWVMLVHAALMVLNIIIGLLVARHYSVEAYGQFSYFLNVFGSLRLIAALGLTSQIVLTLARARGQVEPLAQQFYPLFVVRFATLGFITLGVLGVSYVRQDALLGLAGLTAALALANDFGVGALQGLGQVRPAMSVLALQPVLYAIGAVFALNTHRSIEPVYQVFGLSFLLTLGLTFFWVARAIGRPRGLAMQWRAVFDSLRYAGSMYLQAILGTLFTSYATLYFGATGRYVETALITIPLNLIFTLGVLVQTPMNTVYFPRLGRLYAAYDEAEARRWFGLFYNWVSALTVLATVGACLYPNVALSLLYGAQYQVSAPLLALLAPVAFLYTLQMVLTVTIVAQGRWRAALGAPFMSTSLLLLIITFSANEPLSLWWTAAAHTLAASLGLVWQLQQVGYDLRQPLLQSGKQLLVAALLLGVGRLFVADAPAQTWIFMLTGGLGAALYALWVWRDLQARN